MQLRTDGVGWVAASGQRHKSDPPHVIQPSFSGCSRARASSRPVLCSRLGLSSFPRLWSRFRLCPRPKRCSRHERWSRFGAAHSPIAARGPSTAHGRGSVDVPSSACASRLYLRPKLCAQSSLGVRPETRSQPRLRSRHSDAPLALRRRCPYVLPEKMQTGRTTLERSACPTLPFAPRSEPTCTGSRANALRSGCQERRNSATRPLSGRGAGACDGDAGRTFRRCRTGGLLLHVG